MLRDRQNSFKYFVMRLFAYNFVNFFGEDTRFRLQKLPRFGQKYTITILKIKFRQPLKQLLNVSLQKI